MFPVISILCELVSESGVLMKFQFGLFSFGNMTAKVVLYPTWRLQHLVFFCGDVSALGEHYLKH